LDAIIVDGRIVKQECVDIKPGSEIVSGPQKEGMVIFRTLTANIYTEKESYYPCGFGKP
jgi:hypothetical protein